MTLCKMHQDERVKLNICCQANVLFCHCDPERVCPPSAVILGCTLTPLSFPLLSSPLSFRLPSPLFSNKLAISGILVNICGWRNTSLCWRRVRNVSASCFTPFGFLLMKAQKVDRKCKSRHNQSSPQDRGLRHSWIRSSFETCESKYRRIWAHWLIFENLHTATESIKYRNQLAY